MAGVTFIKLGKKQFGSLAKGRQFTLNSVPDDRVFDGRVTMDQEVPEGYYPRKFRYFASDIWRNFCQLAQCFANNLKLSLHC